MGYCCIVEVAVFTSLCPLDVSEIHTASATHVSITTSHPFHFISRLYILQCGIVYIINSFFFSAPCVNLHNVGAYNDNDELTMTMTMRCLDTIRITSYHRRWGEMWMEGINVYSYFRFMSRVNIYSKDRRQLTGKKIGGRYVKWRTRQ